MFLAGSTNSYGEGGILGAAAGGVGRRRGRGAAVSGGAARARQWQAPLASGTSQCALRRKAGFAAGSAKIRLPERKRRRKAPSVRSCFDNGPSGGKLAPEQGFRTGLLPPHNWPPGARILPERS